MDRDLFLSILSLDAYHRDYNPGLYLANLNVSSGAIGLASLSSSRGGGDDIDAQAAENIGFFAQSYLWNGEKVISYRSTDDGFSAASTGDMVNGFGIGGGSPSLPSVNERRVGQCQVNECG